MISVIILTYNSERTINRTLRSIAELSSAIYVVDSFSTDRTLEICKAAGCRIVQRAFTTYADQRNWAIRNLPIADPWEFHIDADEEVSGDLASEIARVTSLLETSASAYLIRRKIVFMGRELRHGDIDQTWHCRLFLRGQAHCEERLYDQHFVCGGRIAKLRGFMIDHQAASLEEWTSRHNRWSSLEAQELRGKTRTAQIVPRLTGNELERKRYAKGIYYGGPLFTRAFAYVLFRYIVRLGFLDGPQGLIYHVLQGFWFRFLVDAKLYEASNRSESAVESAEQPHRL